MADHVIIGSGINSLVAAALLSRKGRSVIVLERENRLGGCLLTDQITHPGFYHDVMATTFVLFLTSPAFAELSADLEKYGLEFCHTAQPTAVLRPNGRSTVLTTDRAANIAKFDALSDGDGAQYAKDVGAIEADADFLFALLSDELWTWRTTKSLFSQMRKRGLNGLKAWIGDALQPARSWLEMSYESDDIQALFAPWVLHTGLTPESTYSGQMGKVIAYALEAAGAPIVKGGAGQAVDAFRNLIEANGGEIRTNADVVDIIVENSSAHGVRLANGEEIKASNILASSVPSQLYGQLLSDPPEHIEAKKFRHGRGNFQLHYALDGPPEWQSDGLDEVALIHLTDGIDAVSKSSNEAERGMLPETPTICVGQPHRLDPSRCPEGKAILWLQIPDAPSVIKGDAAGTIHGKAWDEPTREAFADRIEAILAKHIKNFDKIKLQRRAYSPIDLENLNINLVGGDPYGGHCGIDQFFTFRPFPTSRNGATSVKGLYQIGASTHPGPGLSGGSGYNVAKRLGG